MAIDATSVYWTHRGDPTGGYVLSVPKAGGEVVTLAAGDRLSGIAVDSTRGYWVAGTSDASSGAVMTLPVGGRDTDDARLAPRTACPSRGGCVVRLLDRTHGRHGHEGTTLTRSDPEPLRGAGTLSRGSDAACRSGLGDARSSNRQQYPDRGTWKDHCPDPSERNNED
jgi:hypothetical protein